MSQTSRTGKLNNYSLAGTQLRPFERILVADSVDIPDLEEYEDSDRVSYRAPKKAQARRFAVSLPWALLLIVATVVIMTGVTLGKARAVSDLENDFAQLQSKYTAAQLECQELKSKLAEACDASFICYYAAQNLGMKLALNEETVQLSAPDTRPYASGQAWLLTGRK